MSRLTKLAADLAVLTAGTGAKDADAQRFKAALQTTEANVKKADADYEKVLAEKNNADAAHNKAIADYRHAKADKRKHLSDIQQLLSKLGEAASRGSDEEPETEVEEVEAGDNAQDLSNRSGAGSPASPPIDENDDDSENIPVAHKGPSNSTHPDSAHPSNGRGGVGTRASGGELFGPPQKRHKTDIERIREICSCVELFHDTYNEVWCSVCKANSSGSGSSRNPFFNGEAAVIKHIHQKHNPDGRSKDDLVSLVASRALTDEEVAELCAGKCTIEVRRVAKSASPPAAESSTPAPVKAPKNGKRKSVTSKSRAGSQATISDLSDGEPPMKRHSPKKSASPAKRV